MVPIADEHIAGFREAVDVVARERKYLAFLEAPPLDDVRRFLADDPSPRAIFRDALSSSFAARGQSAGR